VRRAQVSPMIGRASSSRFTPTARSTAEMPSAPLRLLQRRDGAVKQQLRTSHIAPCMSVLCDRSGGPARWRPRRPWSGEPVKPQGATRGRARSLRSIFTTRTVARSTRPDAQGRDRKMAQRVVNAGIDVSKPCLDVVLWPTRETIRVSRDGGGLRELAAGSPATRWTASASRPPVGMSVR
jgi:hypothetical protein